MFDLGWFRKAVLMTLIVALVTTLPLPMLNWWVQDTAYSALNTASMPVNSHEYAEATNVYADILPDGAHSEGILLDVGAIERALSDEREPESLANPLTISRVQSVYRAADALDGTLVVTFTVSNQQPPLAVPDVPAEATVTETLAMMAEFDYANDPNTLRNVMVADSLTDDATYLSSSPAPDRSGSTSAWNLGDIPPLSSTSFTLTLQVPTNVSDFTSLDSGATAWGTLQGREVSAAAAPAMLAPNTINGEAIGEWLKSTVDADIYDEYMLQQAAELGQSPLELFAYVRSLGYESYKGSLRGTRGTLWSEAGNSLDQASLLIAMLRASGIPARYRHGTLEENLAQALILSMFPEPTRVTGHIPEGTAVSDPANDAQLLAETRDHWWVEAYLPGQGWLDLDPTFAHATVGQRFVTDSHLASDGTDRIAEVPDSTRHKVTLKLKVEDYHPLNTEKGGLEHNYPLNHTFNTVELAGNPVTLGHLVNSSGAGGFIFSTIEHTYVPYFLVGDELIEGDAYQDLISNFPLGSKTHTGAWLLFEVRDADGNLEEYEREIADRIGFEGRQAGGESSFDLSGGNSPLVNPNANYTMLFAPSNVPAGIIQDNYPQVIEALDNAKESRELFNSQDTDEPSADEVPELREATINMSRAAHASQQMQLLNFAATSDFGTAQLGNALLVKPYFDSPRILITAWEQSDADDQLLVRQDLHKNDIRAVTYPTQVSPGLIAFNHARGLQEMTLEALLMEQVASASSESVHRVFKVADEQDIPLVSITASNLDDLAELDISDEAKARITSVLREGVQYMVIVPSSSVTLNGKKTVGWLEVDRSNGQTVDVMENGQHYVAIEFALLFINKNPQYAIAGLINGYFAYTVSFVGAILEQIRSHDVAIKTAWSAAIAKAQSITDQIKKAIGAANKAAGRLKKTPAINYVGAFLKGFGVGTKIAKMVIQSHVDPPLPTTLMQRLRAPIPIPATASTLINIPANTSEGTLSGSLTTSFSTLSSANGSASFYAPALSGLGVGGDGEVYGAANFAGSTTIEVQDAELLIGDAVGSVQVGSQTLDGANGLTLVNYDGAVTISESSAGADTIVLDGTTQFFAFDVTPQTSSTEPVTPMTFQADMTANFDETYTMTVEAPAGWHVELDGAGLATVTPALGALPGEYTLSAVAQSTTYPEQFASALHTVTVTEYEGMEMGVNPDPLITMPWGEEESEGASSETNNGQIQITGAAFTVDLTNTSNLSHTFEIAISGLPEGWLIVSGNEGQTETTVSLPPGGIGQVGLYISPTLTTLPPEGTAFDFTVDAVAIDNPSLSESKSESFVIPSMPFSHLSASPLLIYSSPGGSTTFDVILRNVGNGAGIFPLTVTLPSEAGNWTADFNSPLTVEVEESITQTVTLTTPDGELGRDYAVTLESPAGNYVQSVTVHVRLVGAQAQCAQQAASAALSALEEHDTPLAAAMQNLATTMTALEGNLSDLAQRDRVVSAIGDLITQLADYPTLSAVGSFNTIAGEMANHSTVAELNTDLAALCDAMSAIDVTSIGQYQVHAFLSPGLNATLPNEPVTYTLTIVNQGTEASTYAVNVTSTLPSASDYTIDVAAGESANIPLTFTPTTLGFYDINASVQADPPLPLLGEGLGVRAALNVVDAFVRILEVTPSPAFVETGNSSSDISINVANIANIPLTINAHSEIIAVDGSSQWTNQTEIRLGTGNARSYDLASVNTSGWESGIYTVMVELRDQNNQLLPDGSAYGYLSVGQGLKASHAVQPAIVPPGNPTVTTVITTQVELDLLSGPPSNQATLREEVAASTGPIMPNYARSKTSQSEAPQTSDAEPAEEQSIETTEEEASEAPQAEEEPELSEADDDLAEPFAPAAPSFTSGIVRHEEDDALISYSGDWSSRSESYVSDGRLMRSSTADDSASFTFTGTWLGVGFATSSRGGKVELFIDGESQSIIDTYSRYDDVKSLYLDGLSAGSHTLSLTVLGTSNPNASGTYVELDYIDVWDGSTMADGTFEHESERVRLSTNWAQSNNDAASGGTYIREGSNAWFPFTGDSVTFQALADFREGQVKILIDGQSQGIFELQNVEEMTRPFSFGNLTNGPHVLQVSRYRGRSKIDAFITPGSEPFYEPPARTGIVRYEEDDPALRYNGVPFNQTATSWEMRNTSGASAGYYARSSTTDDTVSLTFTGSWVGVGFITHYRGGKVELFIDGESQRIIDTYSRDEDVKSLYLDGLSAGEHTLSLTVLGTNHPNASGTRVELDYIDVWDGSTMAHGIFEHESERVRLSTNWYESNNDAASGGTYIREGSNAWFSFTGDSVTFQAFADGRDGQVELLIDGQSQGFFDLHNSEDITRPFSFGNLTNGPHVLQVSRYRGRSKIDAFITPGSEPFYEPPTRTSLIRYEEDDPALRYNGVPFKQRVNSWQISDYSLASGGYATWSNVVSDTVSLTFTGSWVGLGLITRSNGGQAEVFIDGESQGVIDTYSSSDDLLSLYYDNLSLSEHTISVTVLDTNQPDSSNTYVRLDYIDVWDGTDSPRGLFEEDDRRVYRSSNWRQSSNERMSGGEYIEDGSNTWFLFTGDEVTYVAVTDRNSNTSAEVFIDGVSQGILDLSYDFSRSPLPIRYTGLGDGAHVMRIANIERAGVDAFDTSESPFVGVPMVEWYDTAPSGYIGMESAAAVGDINGDGNIEIVATSANGNLYVYRGDGADTDDGTPILWSAEVGTGDSPALANLDGQPGAEIIVTSNRGLYAYHNDGTLFWFNDTVRSSSSGEPWSGSAIANLDSDSAPEIVVGGNDCLCVIEADGEVAWRRTFSSNDLPTPPVLADLTGDGTSDILVAQNDTLYLFDYTTSPEPTIVWSRVITAGLKSYGSPAVANIDGQFPGGDPGPEIVMGWDGTIEVLDADDGSVLWTRHIGGGRPTSISIADTDGDGEVEIVTATRQDGDEHKVHVLNADGSLLWDAIVRDSTAATSGTSVHDLDGDGIWEIIANTRNDGLLIFRGDDGTIIFDEPDINSYTLLDYPIVADVDDDGYAEIVAGDPGGIYVIGHDAAWAPSRPLWNQYNYHVTNITNDFTVPESEPDSWVMHNTYRTQTPLRDPFAGYSVDVTHTIPTSGLTVLPDSFSAQPDTPAPSYHWSYQQASPLHTTSFDATLPDMQPGEVRQISEGTEILYELASGQNRLTLPPLYVAAPHIIAIAPISQTTSTGGSTVYDITLSNPSTEPADYSLAISGLPANWANLPAMVNLGAESEVTLPMTITVPTNAPPMIGGTDFVVRVDNGVGGSDQASATLIVADLLDVTIAPKLVAANAGEVVSYTVTINNLESAARTYALTVAGLAGNEVNLPDTVTIEGNSSATVPLTVGAYASRGLHLFAVQAIVEGSGASSQDDAVLEILNDWQVAAALTPSLGRGGAGTPVAYSLSVTNTGSLSDTYDFTIELPTDWSYRLQANGEEVSSLSLTPHLFNAADLTLIVTPSSNATPDNYDFTVSVQSQNSLSANAIVSGQLEVTSLGVQVTISPQSTTLAPTETGSWNVTITNTGSEADTYDLIATGIVAGSAQFTPQSVSLAPGESQTIQLSAAELDLALAEDYPFSVIARSTTDDFIQNQDDATITFSAYEALEMAWQPSSQVLTDSLSASYMLVITNTGNTSTLYQLALDAPQLSTQLETNQVYIPPHMSAAILVTVEATGAGSYSIEGTANSTTSAATVSEIATLIITGSSTPTPTATASPTPTNTAIPATSTAIASATATNTSIPATSTPTASATPTNTAIPATSTPTASATPTNTSIPATSTAIASATPTNTSIPATSTPTASATPTNTPINTAIPATSTATASATPTNTSIPATSTPTASATPTNTSIPATSTPIASATPTNTSIPATSTAIASPTATNTSIPATSTAIASPTATNTAIPATSTPIASATPIAYGCTYTKGYWRTRPELWPIDSLLLGNTTYSQEELLEILYTYHNDDATYILAYQLIAAQLNLANGADNSAVADTITNANNWLTEHPIGSNPQGAERIPGIEVAVTLNDYNEGVIGPGSCFDVTPTPIPPTYTPTPVTNTATPTVIPGENPVLNGSVTLQGRPPAPDASLSLPLHVSLTNLDSSITEVFTTTTDENGYFALTALQAGSYEVAVKNSHSLQNMQAVTLVAGTNTIDFGTLREGDANNDNVISILDFSILASAFGVCQGDNQEADFNGDGCISILDFSLLAGNFGEAGDGQQAPSRASQQGDVTMAIEPVQSNIKPGQRFSVTVKLDAGEQPIDGAQIKLNYDPTILAVEEVIPGGELRLELANQVDNESGTIHVAHGTKQEFPSGEIELLQIQFKALEAGESALTFDATAEGATSSNVTFGGTSVMGSHTDGTIIVNEPTSIRLRDFQSTYPSWLWIVAVLALIILAGSTLIIQHLRRNARIKEW